MNITGSLQRDSIIFKHVTTGGVYLDSSSQQYVLQHRTDSYTYNRIEDECMLANLEFTNPVFNSFVASLRGHTNPSLLSWDRQLPDEMLLSGEVLHLNAGDESHLALIKINAGVYLILDAEDKGKVLSVISSDRRSVFEIGKSIEFDGISEVRVKWLHIEPPSRICRAIDYHHSKHYNRETVPPDISTLIQPLLRALHQNEYMASYDELIKLFTSNGVSSWAVHSIANAYLRKYPII